MIITKLHPARHHQLMRWQYLHVEEAKANAAIAYALLVLSWCVEIRTNAGQNLISTEFPDSLWCLDPRPHAVGDGRIH
jgi:hypothetical protein